MRRLSRCRRWRNGTHLKPADLRGGNQRIADCCFAGFTQLKHDPPLGKVFSQHLSKLFCQASSVFLASECSVILPFCDIMCQYKGHSCLLKVQPHSVAALPLSASVSFPQISNKDSDLSQLCRGQQHRSLADDDRNSSADLNDTIVP